MLAQKVHQRYNDSLLRRSGVGCVAKTELSLVPSSLLAKITLYCEKDGK